MNRAPRQTRREKREAASQPGGQHVRDRIEVELTPDLEEALRKAGPLEPALTIGNGQSMPAGTQLYGVCIMIAGGQRIAALSTVPPLDDKETCPICGSRDFEQTTIGYMPWCPDPNRRTCRCGAKWKLCGNDLPLVEIAEGRSQPPRESEKGSVVAEFKPGRPKDPQAARPVEAVRDSSEAADDSDEYAFPGYSFGDGWGHD